MQSHAQEHNAMSIVMYIYTNSCLSVSKNKNKEQLSRKIRKSGHFEDSSKL